MESFRDMSFDEMRGHISHQPVGLATGPSIINPPTQRHRNAAALESWANGGAVHSGWRQSGVISRQQVRSQHPVGNNNRLSFFDDPRGQGPRRGPNQGHGSELPETLPYNPADYMLPPGVGIRYEDIMNPQARQSGNSRAGDQERQRLPTPRMSYEQMVALDDQNVTRGLSQRAKAQLPRFRVGAEEEGTECAVTMETLKRNEKAIRLKCGHMFKEQGIMPWFQTHRNRGI